MPSLQVENKLNLTGSGCSGATPDCDVVAGAISGCSASQMPLADAEFLSGAALASAAVNSVETAGTPVVTGGYIQLPNSVTS